MAEIKFEMLTSGDKSILTECKEICKKSLQIKKIQTIWIKKTLSNFARLLALLLRKPHHTLHYLTL